MREFILKDAYSFDRDEEGLDVLPQARGGVRPDLRAHRAGVRRAGRVRDDGRKGVRRLPRRRPARARTRSSPAGAATTRPISRSRRASPSRPSFPQIDRPQELETSGVTTIEALAEYLRIDPRRRRRPCRSCRPTEPVLRARPRRRPARGGEARLGAGLGLPAGDRGRDPRRVRHRSGLARADRLRRLDRGRRGAAGGPVHRGRKPDGITSAASSTAGTSRPASPTCASPSKVAAVEVRQAAALPDRGRGRPSSVRRAVLEAARRDVPRHGRPGAAAGGRKLRDRSSARDSRRRRRAAPAGGESSGRVRSPRTMCTSWRFPGVEKGRPRSSACSRPRASGS